MTHDKFLKLGQSRDTRKKKLYRCTYTTQLIHNAWIWMRYDTNDKSTAWISEKFYKCKHTTHSYMMHWCGWYIIRKISKSSLERCVYIIYVNCLLLPMYFSCYLFLWYIPSYLCTLYCSSLVHILEKHEIRICLILKYEGINQGLTLTLPISLWKRLTVVWSYAIENQRDDALV